MLVSKPSVGRIIPLSPLLRYWGNLGKLGPNTPNHVQRHMKSNPKSSAPDFTSNETLLQFMVLCGLSYTCFTGTRVQGYLGKLGPNTPNHVQGHMKNNPKSSAPRFTSNQLLLQCIGPLRVGLYLYYRYLDIRKFGETGPKYFKPCVETHKVIQSFQHYVSH